jgi:hypothetical protein
MEDYGCKKFDWFSLMLTRYIVPFEFTHKRSIDFYRTKARRLNNLYLSNNKELISSYFHEEINNSEFSEYVKDDIRAEINACDLEQLKAKLYECANVVYQLYLSTTIDKMDFSKSYTPPKS